MKAHLQHFATAAVCSILLTCGFAAGQATSLRPIIIKGGQHGVSPAARDLAPSSSVEAQASISPMVPSTAGLNFDGIAAGAENGQPIPDVNGAVGATQYVQTQDTQGGEWAVFDKTTGNMTFGPISSIKIWKGFAAPCGNTVSAQTLVNYDKAAGRWIMARHAYPTTGVNYICIAVSQTSDATGKWNLYGYPFSTTFPDYPKLGVWPDAYYMSFNMLTSTSPHTFIAPMVCAFDRNGMIAGSATPANPICFQPTTTLSTLLPADLDGSVAPPAGSPNYLVNLDANALDIWKFHVDFTTPANSTLTGPTKFAAPAFTKACSKQGGICIPQLASPAPPPVPSSLKTWSDRLMNRLAYRNFGTYESMVVSHAVSFSLTDASSFIRWYEIRSPGTTPVIFQGGTWHPDDTSRWMSSMAMDKVGDIAVGYSESSPSIFPGIAYTVHLATDSKGSLETPENVIMIGSGNQVFNNNWGSYTSMSIDPVDDCTFWYTNQYYTEQGSKIWNTRIASFKFPSCN
jgi:hypothetical protein